LIYKTECIYKKLKDFSSIKSHSDFMNLYKNRSADFSLSDDDILNAFSDLRLSLAKNLKLDNISFLFANGCSIYAGSKSTTDFKMKDFVSQNELSKIKNVIENISNKPMEEQLNSLITIREFYHLTNDRKEQIVDKIISKIKESLLDKYVNSVNYNKLYLHEVMLMKLRSFGCLDRVCFNTLNYDLAFEYVLDKLGIDYDNGFSGFVNRKFDHKSLQYSHKTKLVKLHGSVNWVFDKRDNTIKEIQPIFSENGDVIISKKEHVLIYPTEQKLYQTYNAPYSELMRSMLNYFESERNVILVIGYRYADEHINEILYKAVANPNNIFYFFDYDNGSSPFIKKMIELSNTLQNINILLGEFLGDFETFVKYILPANVEKTDEERIFELLNKVIDKKQSEVINEK